MKTTIPSTFLLGAALLLSPAWLRAESLAISPSEFDFGWCPDNAKISADFTVKNTSSDLIALNSVQPACGCTAANFTPANLGTDKETKIGLIFNTRGYNGVTFRKSTQIRAGNPEQEYSVMLIGTVRDPKVQVAPDGSGIVQFSAGSDSTQSISIVNKSSSTVKLTLVQTPADWISLSIPENDLPAGATLLLRVKAKGDFSVDQTTSATFDVHGDNLSERFTVAMLSGNGPTPVRKIKAPAPSSSPKK